MQLASLPILEDRRHYVYAHAKATTGEIFYIGKGVGKRAKDLRRRSEWHQKVVAKHGCDVHVLEKHMTQNEAYDREAVLVAEGRDMGLDLVNLDSGGLGGRTRHSITRAQIGSSVKKTMTPSKRAKISENSKNMSPESREKIKTALLGRPRSDEVKEKIRLSMVGKKYSAERCANMSSAVLKAMTPERRAQISDIQRGRVTSEETKAKMSAARKGRKLSEETRAKISATLKARKKLNII